MRDHSTRLKVDTGFALSNAGLEIRVWLSQIGYDIYHASLGGEYEGFFVKCADKHHLYGRLFVKDNPKSYYRSMNYAPEVPKFRKILISARNSRELFSLSDGDEWKGIELKLSHYRNPPTMLVPLTGSLDSCKGAIGMCCVKIDTEDIPPRLLVLTMGIDFDSNPICVARFWKMENYPHLMPEKSSRSFTWTKEAKFGYTVRLMELGRYKPKADESEVYDWFETAPKKGFKFNLKENKANYVAMFGRDSSDCHLDIGEVSISFYRAQHALRLVIQVLEPRLRDSVHQQEDADICDMEAGGDPDIFGDALLFRKLYGHHDFGQARLVDICEEITGKRYEPKYLLPTFRDESFVECSLSQDISRLR